MLLQCYVGDDGVAHKVIKGYVGVNGVAKKIYEPEVYKEEVIKNTNTLSLNTAKSYLAATTVGNYALFGGGCSGSDSNYDAGITVYNNDLVRSTATSLNVARRELAATTVGNYALFGGGYNSGYSTITSRFRRDVDVYNNDLVHSTATSLSIAKYYLAATTVGNYALFGGGYTYISSNNTTPKSNIVDAYNNDLVRSTTTSLSSAGGELAATTVGNYALFGGGYNNDGYGTATVNAYNNDLVRSTTTSLSVARYELAATTVGNYALFGGGRGSGSGYSSTADAYNNDLVRSTATSLNVARSNLAATTVGNYALFGGGYNSSYNSTYDRYRKDVDAYNNDLVRSTATSLNECVGKSLAATTVGEYSLFGGGYGYKNGTNTYFNSVYVYKYGISYI